MHHAAYTTAARHFLIAPLVVGVSDGTYDWSAGCCYLELPSFAAQSTKMEVGLDILCIHGDEANSGP